MGTVPIPARGAILDLAFVINATPIRNVATLAINKCTDDIAESSEGQVDLDALLQPVTCR